MKILSAEQIRSADQFTIQSEPINSVDLMERAAGKCYEWIKGNFSETKTFHVFCGIGNNGGDGLVIARKLFESGFDVRTYIVRFSDKCSDDFLINESRLKATGVSVSDITDPEFEIAVYENDIIIDAIFGTGLTRPIEGLTAGVIHKINSFKRTVIAVDCPSGLFCEDNSGNIPENIIKAKYTLTFQVPKLAFLFSENHQYVGKWQILDIGLDINYIESLATGYHYLTESVICGIYQKRSRFSHKGTFGHALIMAGSVGKLGAAVLASKACLRAGAGLVTAHIPSAGNIVMQAALPEAMVSSDPELNLISEIPKLNNYNAVGIGPGIGTDKITANAFKQLIQNSSVPIVIDADGLNILSENKTWLAFLPSGSILTPHPKEFERLYGIADNGFHRLQILKDEAFRRQVYIVLKGAFTAIATPGGNIYFNSTGNPGMATGGSGDVLTGIITGLLAQGYSSLESCLLGVYIHGLAGDCAAAELGEEAMIAGDITNYLGKAFLSLNERIRK